MIHSFYTSATGTIESSKNMEVIANNLANVNTHGFKRDRGVFADLLYTNMRAAEGDTDLKKGHGARLAKADTVHGQGAAMRTEKNLDFMINDSTSFFAVQTPNGVKYTRNGAFTLSEEGGQTYLVTDVDSGYVLNTQGQRIIVTDDALTNNPDSLNIGLVTFPNLDGLQKQGGTWFVPTENSGGARQAQAQVDGQSLIRQGYLEGSTVDIADEITNMITTQRGFQANTKLVQTADEIMQTVNGLR